MTEIVCLMKTNWEKVLEATDQIIFDKKNEIKLCLVAILSRGHLLIEDVPGVGKTTLVQTLAKLLGMETSRIQFTSDLLPSDIIGNTIYDPEKKEFKFFQGPLFANLVLADELNRANPRTQSALLQAMEEGQVSSDRKTMSLPDPFFLIATQNPRHQTGTFPLPESQLDRFLLSLNLNYASPEAEMKIFKGMDPRKKMAGLFSLMSVEEIREQQDQVDNVFTSDLLIQFISKILIESRKKSDLYQALSTRTGLALTRAAKAWAFLDGRDHCLPEDVKSVAPAVLAHRLGGVDGVLDGYKKANDLLRNVEVPT